MSTVVDRATQFAAIAHFGQYRKYTGAPYITHPIAVANILKQTVDHTPAMLAAAILHDTVEDCDITLADIEYTFGKEIMQLVFWLTDVSTLADGNRAARKAAYRTHLSQAPAAAQTIKVADICHNSECIARNDPDFWIVYQREKQQLLHVLDRADPTLLDMAWKIVGHS